MPVEYKNPLDFELKFNEIQVKIIECDDGLDGVEVTFSFEGKPMCFFRSPLRDDEVYVLPNISGTITGCFVSV